MWVLFMIHWVAKGGTNEKKNEIWLDRNRIKNHSYALHVQFSVRISSSLRTWALCFFRDSSIRRTSQHHSVIVFWKGQKQRRTIQCAVTLAFVFHVIFCEFDDNQTSERLRIIVYIQFKLAIKYLSTSTKYDWIYVFVTFSDAWIDWTTDKFNTNKIYSMKIEWKIHYSTKLLINVEHLESTALCRSPVNVFLNE